MLCHKSKECYSSLRGYAGASFGRNIQYQESSVRRTARRRRVARNNIPCLPLRAFAQLACCAFALSACSFLTGCHPQHSDGKVLASPPTQPSAKFTDVAKAAGINYQWHIEGKRPLNILQTIGNGCAFLDYDNDGNLDILLVGPKLALYQGDGKGHFTDVTQATGLDKFSGHFLGCAVADYDNDGYPDIYISGYRTGLLLHNQPSTRASTRREGHNSQPSTRIFRDVSRQTGMKPQPWGTACAWAETVPGSGRLDLFVANYARFGLEAGSPQLCESRGLKTSCGPASYKPLPGVFYRNLGNGRFQEDTHTLNLVSTHGRGLGAAFVPLETAMPPTLAIANDELFGDLLTPQKTGNKNEPLRYVNSAAAAGVAGDRDGNIHGGMGADWGDYDNDGQFDLFVATFRGEAKSLYHNDGSGTFSDATYLTGIAPVAMDNVSFGCKLFDFDNDGLLDLIIASGHVQDNIQAIEASATYRQKLLLLHNRCGKTVTFENVSGTAGADFGRELVGRGLAIGDYDNDGREDALVVDSEGSPLLLHNETPAVGNWLGVTLRGTHCNRDGIGAVVTASMGGHTLTRLCHTDGSYLSASDRRVHFGLGAAQRVDTLTIRWPDGRTDTLKNVTSNRYIMVKEGDSPL